MSSILTQYISVLIYTRDTEIVDLGHENGPEGNNIDILRKYEIRNHVSVKANDTLC